MRAHVSLSEALHAIGRNGDPDLDLDSYYSDSIAVFELVTEIDVAHSNMLRWLAALEGRESLTRLMLNGPPGFESRELRGTDGSVWWTMPDPDELRDGDGNILGRESVEHSVGPLIELNQDNVRRVMVAPDGHCWELGVNMGPEFDAGVKASYEREHGELLDLRLFAADISAVNGLWHVEEATATGVRMTVPASLTRDYAALYRAVLDQRSGAGNPGNVRLLDPMSGDRYTVSPAGRLFNENMAPVPWPDMPSLHRWFPARSPEPADVRLIKVATSSGGFNGGTLVRSVRDRRDHDRDLWGFEGTSADLLWSYLNQVDVIEAVPFEVKA